MKQSTSLLISALVVFFVLGVSFVACHASYVTKIYMEPGGDKQIVATGGEVEIQSGATLDVQTGAVSTKPVNMRYPLFLARNVAGTSIAASAATATDFIAALNNNNAPDLTGTNAQNNTKANNALFEFVLPDDYKAGTDITAYIGSGYSASGGTTITATVDAVATLQGDTGTAAADICATAAQAISLTIAEKAFTITGTTLTPGARLMLKVTTSVQEAGNTGTAAGHVYGVRLAQ